MKLNELREIIGQSAIKQRKTNAAIHTSVEDYFEAKDDVVRLKKILNKLQREGKLDIDVDILAGNISKYFKEKHKLDAEVSYTQYTDNKDIYPYFDEKRPVLNANAVGLITIAGKGIISSTKVYQLFDVKADLGEVANIKMFDDERMVVTNFRKVNILDLVPSYKYCFMERNSELLKKYPGIMDAIFESLDQTQKRKVEVNTELTK